MDCLEPENLKCKCKRCIIARKIAEELDRNSKHRAYDVFIPDNEKELGRIDTQLQKQRRSIRIDF